MFSKPELIGHIGVDAGLCWIGDPCYILHAEKRPESIGKDWDEFCQRMGDLQSSFNYDLGHEGLGVCVSTGYGDGTYPVTVTRDKNNRIATVTVTFIEKDGEHPTFGPLA